MGAAVPLRSPVTPRRIRITGLTLRRTLLNAAQPGGAFLTGELAFADDASGFDYAAATYTSATSGQQLTLRFSRYGSSFRSGLVSGTVVSSALLPPQAAPGSWQLTSLLVVDWAGTTLDHAVMDADWPQVLADSGITGVGFRVDNPTPDLTPPTLLGFSFANTVIELSGAAAGLLSGSLKAADPGSGVDSIELDFVGRLAAGDAHFTTTIRVDHAWRTSGTALEGTWRWTSDLFAAGPLGVKTLKRISLTDRAGNRWTIDSSSADWGITLQRLGLGAGVIDVRGAITPPPSSDSDRSAPVMVVFEVLNPVVAPAQSGGDVLTTSLTFADVGTGFGSAVASFVADGSGARFDVIFARDRGVVAGSWSNGNLSLSTPLDPHLAPGFWRLNALTITDGAGNSSSPTPPAVAFTVLNPNGDSEPPLLTSFSLDTPGLDVLQAGGAVLSGRLGFIDDRSGFASAVFRFTAAAASLPPLSLVFAVADGSFPTGAVEAGSALGGSLSASTVLDATTPAGTYTLASVQWQDQAGNQQHHRSDDGDWSTFLATLGFAAGRGVTVVNATRDRVSLVNGLELFSDSTGQYAIADGASVLPLSISAETFPGWQLLAAARSAGGVQLLWRETATGLLLPWLLDSSGRQVGDLGMVSPSSAEARQLEGHFQIDLDGNGSIGSAEAELARGGSASLWRRGGDGRLAVRIDSRGTPIDLTWGGRPLMLEDPRLPGWRAVAATVAAGGVELLWRHGGAGLLATWTFDSTGVAQGGTAPVAIAGSGAEAFERRFAVELNGDRSLDAGDGVAARSDSLELLRSGSGQWLVRGRDGVAMVPSWGGTPLKVMDPRLPGWTVLAAAVLDGVNTLLWRHGSTGALTTWTFDGGWAASGGGPVLAADSAKALSLEDLFQCDADGDRVIGNPWVAMATAGTVALLRRSGSGALAAMEEGDRPVALSWAGTPLLAADPRLPGWVAVAATRADGVNRLLWRHKSAGLLASWTLDDGWAVTGGAAPVAERSVAAQGLERQFSIDANGDGGIGSPSARRISVAIVGGLELLRSASDGALVLTTVSLVPNDVRILLDLTWGGSPLRDQDPRLPGWTALAVTAVQETVQLLWRHGPSGQLATWTFDADLAASGGTTPVAADAAEAYALESLFGLDANGDGSIGSPWSTIAQVDGLQLLQQSGSGGLAIAPGGAAPVPLLWAGQPLRQGDQRLPGWTALAAATLDEGNMLLWRHGPSGELATWTLDALWSPTGGTAPVRGSSAAAATLESRFGLDANGDGIIGSPWITIARTGVVTLVRHGVSGQLAVAVATAEPLPLHWGGAPLLEDDPRLPGWTLLAAGSSDGVNRLLWRHGASGQLASWSCDGSWTPTGGTAPVAAASPAAMDLEVTFGLDANADGFIAAEPSPIEVLRSRIRAAAPEANARDPFTWVQTGGEAADLLQAAPLGRSLLTAVDLLTGLPAAAGVIDVMECSGFSGGSTLVLTSPAGTAPVADGDSGYTLVRHLRLAADDLVVSAGLALAAAQRTVAGPDGAMVTGLALHIDSNRNGVVDAADNLFALLEGVTLAGTAQLPPRLVRI